MTNKLKYRTSTIGKIVKSATLATALVVFGCQAEPPIANSAPAVSKASGGSLATLKAVRALAHGDEAPALQKASASQPVSASQKSESGVIDVIEGLKTLCKESAGTSGLQVLEVVKSLKLKGAPEVVVQSKTDWGTVLVTRKNGVDIKADPAPYGSLFGMFTPLLMKNPKTRHEMIVLVCPKADQPEDRSSVKMATAVTVSMRDILVKSKVPPEHQKKEKLREDMKRLQEKLKEIQAAVEANGD